MKINVLSLFGGIECGRVAMDRLGWEVGNYYSSEIDEYAKKITSARWPEIIHIGSVTDVSYHKNLTDKVGRLHWKTPDGDAIQETNIDILIGGSPCQDLSIAKAWGKGLEGEKSGLFYEYVRILQETKPEYFLLENVASMRKADRDKISEVLGIEPIMINSNLVSAQNRKRLYWIGKKLPGGWYEKVEVQQPEDWGILLADILEDIPLDDERWKLIPEKYLTGEGKVRLKEATKKGFIEVWHGDVVDINRPNSDTHRGRLMEDKAHTLTANMYKGDIPHVIAETRNRKDEPLRVFADQEKSPALRSAMGTGGGNVPIIVSEKSHRQLILWVWSIYNNTLNKEKSNTLWTNSQCITAKSWQFLLAENENIYLWRKLTPIECERLQTLPDNYTACVSDSRRYKAIGNGWTVDIIAYILSHFHF